MEPENVENFDSQSTVEEKLAALEKEYADFRLRVAEKAAKLATENDWCDQVNDALEELGLPTAEKFTLYDDEVYVVVGTKVEDEDEATDEEKAARLEAFRKWANHPDRKVDFDSYRGPKWVVS